MAQLLYFEVILMRFSPIYPYEEFYYIDYYVINYILIKLI